MDSLIPIILPNLNPICHLLALGAHHNLHVGTIRVNAVAMDSLIPITLPNLNPICHLLALGVHHILHVGRIRVKKHTRLYTEVTGEF
jgi:hypothetical protein